MKYPSVYDLSKRYGPPRISIRDAEIMDDYGDTTNASRRISHTVPDDVTREDLDCYFLYSYLELEDLLFYLYPVALECERDPGLHWIDFYMWSLEAYASDAFAKLSDVDRAALLTGNGGSSIRAPALVWTAQNSCELLAYQNRPTMDLVWYKCRKC